MKKAILGMVLLILSFVLTGCDFFGTPYDKMMNQFENEIKDAEIIKIEQDVNFDFTGVGYNVQDSRSTYKMTYYTEDQSIHARVVQLGTASEFYFIQKEDDLLAYYIDGTEMTPIDLKEIQDLIPFDRTLFNLEDYTGKASWESEFEEVEEGVFSVEISLSTLFDDEMFKDIEDSFTQNGFTIEDLNNKSAKITISYDETTNHLNMSFDMESFEVGIYSSVYTLKIDQDISISVGTEEPFDLNLYHSYPVENTDQLIRTYSPNEYFKGEFWPLDRGYFRFELTVGKYTLIDVDSTGSYELFYYDTDLVLINPNLDGTITVDKDGIYYVEVVSKNDHGRFELKLVKTK